MRQRRRGPSEHVVDGEPMMMDRRRRSSSSLLIRRGGSAILALAVGLLMLWLSRDRSSRRSPTFTKSILAIERTRRQTVSVSNRYLDAILDGNHATAQPLNLETPTSVSTVRVTSMQVIKESTSPVCRPGWLCRQCLAARRLVLWSCRSACPCLPATIRCETEAPADTLLSVVVESTSSTHRIPRIIHQFTDGSGPHGNRLQHSWRAQPHWRLQTYTPSTMADFVHRHYPKLLQLIYDILPEPLQEDLFRLLVVFYQGGIYADVDLTLETNLDVLIPSDVGLVVAQDTHGCLWKGFLAAEPGHPVVAKAMEGLVEAVLRGSPDVAAYILQEEMKSCVSAESLRETLPMDAMFGGCLWSRSFNQVLGRPWWQAMEPGWMTPTSSVLGRMLILLVRATTMCQGVPAPRLTLPRQTSPNDTGATRLTDVERNLLVVSTDFMGIPRQQAGGRDRVGQQEPMTSWELPQNESWPKSIRLEVLMPL